MFAPKATPVQTKTAASPGSKPAPMLQQTIGNHAALRLLAQQMPSHAQGTLHRAAAGPAPRTAPPLVHEVLRESGQPLPEPVRETMEAMLGRDFADVRLHTGERAGESAAAVEAQAYTVGRHVVFAPGQFQPGTAPGRHLLAHELTHAAAHEPTVPTPAGVLRISAPDDAAERHAVAVADGRASLATMLPASAELQRQGTAVPLTGISVSATLNGAAITADRFTVPMENGVAIKANIAPANATDVTLSILKDTAVIAAGTTIDSKTGVITVAADQVGGTATIKAAQPDKTTQTTSVVFTAIPGKIASTSANRISSSGIYGGLFRHTFTSPAGGGTALRKSHVNEKFAVAKGNKLIFTGGPLAAKATLTINVNNPDSASDGWDLDSSGQMIDPDRISWADNLADARPFVKNASNPTPTATLPQELTATQELRNLSFPSKKYGAAIDSTTHRRALEDRKDGGQDRVKAITSANKTEVVDDYAGPTVFRHASADPASVPAATPAPPGGKAPKPTTSRIKVQKDGQSASENYEVRDPKNGCTVDAFGLFTPGTVAGPVTVRVGDGKNFDDVTVTVTAAAPAPAAPPSAPTNPGAKPTSAEESPASTEA